MIFPKLTFNNSANEMVYNDKKNSGKKYKNRSIFCTHKMFKLLTIAKLCSNIQSETPYPIDQFTNSGESRLQLKQLSNEIAISLTIRFSWNINARIK